jgi:hypothetical protein
VPIHTVSMLSHGLRRHCRSAAGVCSSSSSSSSGSNVWRSGGGARTTRSPRRTGAAASSKRTEVRICTGKTCKRQGSEQVRSDTTSTLIRCRSRAVPSLWVALASVMRPPPPHPLPSINQVVRFGEQLGLPGIEVTAGGCLGNCGAGPNLVLLPEGEVLRHVGTPALLAEVLTAFCGADVGADALRSTELRIAGNALAMAGDLAGAVERCAAGGAGLPRGDGIMLPHAWSQLQAKAETALICDAGSGHPSHPSSTHHTPQVPGGPGPGPRRIRRLHDPLQPVGDAPAAGGQGRGAGARAGRGGQGAQGVPQGAACWLPVGGLHRRTAAAGHSSRTRRGGFARVPAPILAHSSPARTPAPQPTNRAP